MAAAVGLSAYWTALPPRPEETPPPVPEPQPAPGLVPIGAASGHKAAVTARDRAYVRGRRAGFREARRGGAAPPRRRRGGGGRAGEAAPGAGRVRPLGGRLRGDLSAGRQGHPHPRRTAQAGRALRALPR